MSTNKIGATPEMRDTPKFGLGLAFDLPTFSHCPHQKKFFALKHLSDPIYQIKTRSKGSVNLPQGSVSLVVLCKVY